MKSINFKLIEAPYIDCVQLSLQNNEMFITTGCVNDVQNEIMLHVTFVHSSCELKNIGLLENAIAFATDRHAGTFRKCIDMPYIIHPMEAVSIAAGITSDVEILAAVVLHDVVEDTPVTLSEIEDLFGKRIAALVAAESEEKMPGILPSESWEVRKRATVQALRYAMRDEKIITLADKLSNLRSIYRDLNRIGESIWVKFNQKDKKKHEWYYRGIASALAELSDYLAYKEFNMLIDNVFA